MAGETALAPRDRRVAEPDLFPLRRVAVEAEVVTFLSKQLYALRGVWIMAGEAHSTLKGLMLHGSPSFQAFRVMAVGAKLAPFFCQGKGFVRCSGLVAGVTLNRGNRVMRTRFQKFCLQRRMGIMAA